MATANSACWQSDWQKHCIVCRKSLLHSDECCHVRTEGEMVALCGPFCFETFEKNPQRFLRLRRLRHLKAETRARRIALS